MTLKRDKNTINNIYEILYVSFLINNELRHNVVELCVENTEKKRKHITWNN